MATKSEKNWGMLLGGIAGAIIGYHHSDDPDLRLRNTLVGAGLGIAGGYGLACLLGEPSDTLNYTCLDNGKPVYTGICFNDRKWRRMAEHRAAGKEFDRVLFSPAKPRSVARVHEAKRIQRMKPKYNIQLNKA
ncbi:MAG: hypothetical protein EOP04_01760 [Proteobacteria bacterium]|nr:MAG: hypothetical protein EOP04_01760 [Pseudomonadota bacterium]